VSSIVHRLGTFVTVLGLGVLFLFVLSELAQLPDFDLLFLSMLLFGAGWLLRRRRPPPAPSGRFSMLRRRRRSPPEGTPQDDPQETPQ
jgi:flagellar biosynthesis component FlhA